MTDEDYKKKVDELQKNEPRKWDHIQKERNKIRDKEFNKSLKEAATHKEEVVQFERPHADKMPDRIGGMDTKGFHVEKGEEKNTYRIVTKREYTFAYQIRAKSEEDAMIRTLTYVSKDGSGQYLKGPMQLGKPLIREWIDKIEKIG
jgi:Rps23 Pro-64 3,4-dihydroxylase Tpa1-like proline 4-hydroxylase